MLKVVVVSCWRLLRGASLKDVFRSVVVFFVLFSSGPDADENLSTYTCDAIPFFFCGRTHPLLPDPSSPPSPPSRHRDRVRNAPILPRFVSTTPPSSPPPLPTLQSKALRQLSIGYHRRSLGLVSLAVSRWRGHVMTLEKKTAVLRRLIAVRRRRELVGAMRRWGGAVGAERAAEGLARRVEWAVRRARVARAVREW